MLDKRDRRHQQASDWYATVTDEAATTPLVLAEVDHLAFTRAGANALRAFRKDLARGAYFVDWWSIAAAEIAEIAEGYVDLGVSLADASLIALAGSSDLTAATGSWAHEREAGTARGKRTAPSESFVARVLQYFRGKRNYSKAA